MNEYCKLIWLFNLNFFIRKKKKGNNEYNFYCDVLYELYSF